jgi:cell division control protein 6
MGMTDYFSGAGRERGIIGDESALLPDYLPDEILHRERELQAIADSVKPLLVRRTPDNLFIHGASGTGKTTCVKYLLKQLTGHSSSVLPVYVNCWENPTQVAVYNRIIEEMRLPIPRRGLASDEIFDRIMEYSANYKKPILLVLDEMDGLRHEKLLYSISRSNEKRLTFGIIGISNSKSLLSRLDARIRSSLRFVEMEFKPYSEEQLLAIIRTRAERALSPGSYDDRLLLKIARSVDDGSARVAIGRLWKAAKRAESAGRDKIMLQDFEDALSGEATFKLAELKLTAEEEFIVELLKAGALSSSEIYTAFIAKFPKTKRQIRNYIGMLERKGMILSEDTGPEGGLLRQRMLRLNDHAR